MLATQQDRPSTQILIDSYSLMQQVKRSKFEDFFYKALKMRFFDLQLEAKVAYDWEEPFAFGLGTNSAWVYYRRLDDKLRGEKCFNAYNNCQIGQRKQSRMRYRDIEQLAKDNDYMIKNKINYLPDEMIDPSIINLLKKETGLLPRKETQYFASSGLVEVSQHKYQRH